MFKIGDIVEITAEAAATGMLNFKDGKGYKVESVKYYEYNSTGRPYRKDEEICLTNESDVSEWYAASHFKPKKDTIVEKKECLFKEGQVVWDVVYGKGTVVEIAKDSIYPVVVQFSDGTMAYSEDGKTYETHGRTLFFSEPKIEAATEPVFEPTLKEGDKVVIEFEDGSVYACIVKEELEDSILTGRDGWIYKQGTKIFRVGEKINFK